MVYPVGYTYPEKGEDCQNKKRMMKSRIRQVYPYGKDICIYSLFV